MTSLPLVVDASVVAGWVFQDERTAHSDAALRQVESVGAVVPALWTSEVANMLVNGVRRGRLTSAEARVALAGLCGLPVRLDDAAPMALLSRVFELASQSGLTAYDASYLELAQRLGLVLATLDARLRAAAPGHGVSLF